MCPRLTWTPDLHVCTVPTYGQFFKVPPQGTCVRPTKLLCLLKKNFTKLCVIKSLKLLFRKLCSHSWMQPLKLQHFNTFWDILLGRPRSGAATCWLLPASLAQDHWDGGLTGTSLVIYFTYFFWIISIDQGVFHWNQKCEALGFLSSFNDSAMSQSPHKETMSKWHRTCGGNVTRGQTLENSLVL